jgi:glutathione peroxidase
MRRVWQLVLAAGVLAASGSASAKEPCPTLLDHEFPALQDQKSHSLCEYRGKVLLVVNTASKCSYTPQFDGLEALYDRYREQGLVVIGFPTNDFGKEPGSDAQIADFCRTTYGVRFPMFGKTSVLGEAANPFYQALAKASGTAPRWNFHKYLIDRSGTRVTSFPTEVTPESRLLLTTIEEALAEKP